MNYMYNLLNMAVSGNCRELYYYVCTCEIRTSPLSELFEYLNA